VTAQTNEKVEITGMLRDQEPPNAFTPVNDPSREQWVFANIAEMAKHTGSEPVLVDEIYSESIAFFLSPISIRELTQSRRVISRQPWKGRDLLTTRNSGWTKRIDRTPKYARYLRCDLVNSDLCLYSLNDPR